MNTHATPVLFNFAPARVAKPVSQALALQISAYGMARGYCRQHGIDTRDGKREALAAIQAKFDKYAVSAQQIAKRQLVFFPRLSDIRLADGEIRLAEPKEEHLRIFSSHEDTKGADLKLRHANYGKIVSDCLDGMYEGIEQAPDDLIHVTCSGYLAPSPVERMVASREWFDTTVTHSYHMGCYGAFPAIKMAHGFLASSHSGATLPFVGTVDAFQPGARIGVTRRLSVGHDLYLADHHFVHAPGIKPLEACFPVLPMTVSLEAMAEIAACLAPGQGLVGFEAVTARRWIALEDGAALELRIDGRVRDGPAEDGLTRIAVQVFTGNAGTAAIDATVCFSTHHLPGRPALAPPSGGTERNAAALYGERHLFHGPRFQRLVGPVRADAGGASGQLQARLADDWFAGERCPQLLTDAALLDTVGQLAAVWAMQQGRAAFPIGLDRLELHGPTPEPGARLPIRLRIVDQRMKVLVADAEIGDGNGGLWLRISGWKSWQFDWAPQLVAFQRKPASMLLGQEQPVPGAGAGVACRRIEARVLKGFDLGLLARHYLHDSEWQDFAAKSALPARQVDWLLGRIAAKDAARAWCAHRGLHPAAFAIVNGAAGQPAVSYWPPDWPVPCISIAHADGQAIALASDGPAGVDIEKIVARDAGCVAAFCTEHERRLLDGLAAPERAAWATRLWCAKEAFGKRLGTGVAGGPQRFEAQSLAPGSPLPVRHAASGSAADIHTLRDGDYILAFDISPSPAATGESSC